MKSFSPNCIKYFWFSGGLLLGITLISLGHAALPKRVMPPQTAQTPARGFGTSPVSEMKGGRVNSPNLESDFVNLNSVEQKYAENWDQQQRLKAATTRVARVVPTGSKKAKHK